MPELSINALVIEAHEIAREHGFYEAEDEIDFALRGIHAEQLASQAQARILNGKLMGVVGELAEAHEEVRNGDRTALVEELADAFIRLADLCGALEVEDMAAVITQKMAFNRGRLRYHGKSQRL